MRIVTMSMDVGLSLHSKIHPYILYSVAHNDTQIYGLVFCSFLQNIISAHYLVCRFF